MNQFYLKKLREIKEGQLIPAEFSSLSFQLGLIKELDQRITELEGVRDVEQEEQPIEESDQQG